MLLRTVPTKTHRDNKIKLYRHQAMTKANQWLLSLSKRTRHMSNHETSKVSSLILNVLMRKHDKNAKAKAI